MDKFRDWPLLHEMPDGWKIDKTCGSPLAGYVFITNGKSVLCGGKRALLFIGKQKQIISKVDDCVDNIGITHGNKEIKSKNDFAIDASCARAVNELARESFKLKILNDILCDLTICEIEGWCKIEYINQIKNLVNGIGCNVLIDSPISKAEPATNLAISKMENTKLKVVSDEKNRT